MLANGGLPAFGALLATVLGHAGLWPLATGLAAAAADTWATALGATSPTPPRHLLTRARLAPGTSGGVTWRGTLGGALGAASIGLIAAGATRGAVLPLAALVIGTSGMLLDSLLGATIQGRFHCPTCGTETERRHHRCGTRSVASGGVPWISNDVVNALATGAATAAGWWWIA